MGTTSIGSTIDYLVAMVEALKLTASDMDGAPPVLVTDGYPGTYEPTDIISIGGEVTPTEEGDQTWAGLGAGGMTPLDEKYQVEIIISVWRATPDSQKAARDQALRIYTAVQSGIRADLTLGGAVRFCRISRFRLGQTDVQNAGLGRVAEITFWVACEHRI